MKHSKEKLSGSRQLNNLVRLPPLHSSLAGKGVVAKIIDAG